MEINSPSPPDTNTFTGSLVQFWVKMDFSFYGEKLQQQEFNGDFRIFLSTQGV